MAFTGQLSGNLGRDPELRYLDNGKTVANFTLAVRQNKKDAPARWVKVAVWGKPAEYVGNYVRKGDSVICFGRVEAPELCTRKDGTQGLAEVFTAENIEKWGERQAQQGQAPAQQPAVPAAVPAAHPAHAAAGWQPNPQQGTVAANWNSAPTPVGGMDDHDDIPF